MRRRWVHPARDRTAAQVPITHAGLKRIGLPREILDGFPLEFRVAMSERKEFLGDTGESDPAHWDYPFGSTELHTALMVMAPDRQSFDAKLAIGHAALAGLPGVEVIGQLDVSVPSNLR
jgi:hypothetical protein